MRENRKKWSKKGAPPARGQKVLQMAVFDKQIPLQKIGQNFWNIRVAAEMALWGAILGGCLGRNALLGPIGTLV